jgi:hypothetical protein
MNTLLIPTLQRGPTHWLPGVPECENLASQAALFAPAEWKTRTEFRHNLSTHNPQRDVEIPNDNLARRSVPSTETSLILHSLPTGVCVPNYVSFLSLHHSFLHNSISFLVLFSHILFQLFLLPSFLIFFLISTYLQNVPCLFLRNDSISRETILQSSSIWVEESALK